MLLSEGRKPPGVGKDLKCQSGCCYQGSKTLVKEGMLEAKKDKG